MKKRLQKASDYYILIIGGLVLSGCGLLKSGFSSLRFVPEAFTANSYDTGVSDAHN